MERGKWTHTKGQKGVCSKRQKVKSRSNLATL